MTRPWLPAHPVHSRPGCGLKVICAALAVLIPSERGFLLADSPSTGQWLLNHGRNVGLATPSPAAEDAETVLVWMEAAARVDPDLAEAYLWQYDLLGRLNRPEAARAALQSYCRLRPDDVSARLTLLDSEFENGQSVETRLAFCSQTLGGEGVSALVQSDVHRRIAQLHASSGDRDGAEAHAGQAIAAFAGNVAALNVWVDLADAQSRPLRQVRMLLAAIAAAPGSAPQMWQLASVLDQMSLHEEAARWYERALDLYESPAGGQRPPAELLLAFAASCLDGGQYERALTLGERVVAVAPQSVEARFLLLDVAQKTGRSDVAEQHAGYLTALFQQQQDNAPAGFSVLATAHGETWYYLRHQPDPNKALEAATRARQMAPDRPDIEGIYGLAQLAAGDAQTAEEVLRPWAEARPWAAAGLGEALLAQGRTDEAIAALRQGEALRFSGPAYERIVTALASCQQEPAPVPSRSAIRETLRGFDEACLSFPSRPGEFLRLEVIPQGRWAFGEPWSCEFRLTNVGTFPISVGQGQMIEGSALVSLRWGESPQEQLVGYLPISLAQTPVLPPGETLSMIRSLDIGPAAALARSAPQREWDLELSVVLDPVVGAGGKLESGLPGFSAVDVRAKRAKVDASRAGMRALLARLREGTEPERIAAVRAVAALIVEREAARHQPPDYFVHRVDELKLRKMLLSALADPAPQVRAAALDALRAVDLGPRTLEQAAPSLSDPHWLVRLLAIDVLSASQGDSFRPVLERTATADPDNLVRRLAKLHLHRVEAKPTQTGAVSNRNLPRLGASAAHTRLYERGNDG